jgi:hypothetical protein
MKKVINSEQIFVESPSLREEYIDKFDILDKIKVIPYLTNDLVVSVEQVANFYEVGNKAINTIVDRHRDELEDDGVMVLRGESLKEFKGKVCYPQGEESKISNKTTQLTILTKRAMLRIGMLLTNSSVATKVRNYLLNLEENSTVEQKQWAIQREASKIDRKRMTTAINTYIPISPNKRFVYTNYTNMIYKLIFGKDAKSIRSERGITKDSELTRDKFSEQELRLVDEAETIVTALVTLGFGYDYIKEQLEKKYTKVLS